MKATAHTIALILGVVMISAAAPTLAQQQVTPNITVRQEDGQTLREYRVDGKLYAIEIESPDGSSYHLLDTQGDGHFERRQGDRIAIPNWVLRR